MFRRSPILILSFLLLMPVFSYAQKNGDCEATLNLAESEFNAGHFNNISSLLNECLDKFSNAQRERAYMLLTQTYLLLDDPFGAEQSYLSLLRANPEFIADENRDQIDVVYLSKKFTSSPIFSWYLGIGGNVSTISVLNTWSTVNVGKKYSVRPGFQFGGGLDYNFNDNIVITGELNFAFTSFKINQKAYFGGNDYTEVIDKQSWLSVPLMAKYVMSHGKIRPYAYIGYSFNFLLIDQTSIKMTNGEPAPTEGGETTYFPADSPPLNYTSHRQGVNRSFLFGAGAKYKAGLDYFFADIRFSLGMTNVVNPDARYSNMQWVTEFGYVEDDMRINNAYISVGYIHPLYKPRKLKKARTRSVFRKIGKQSSNVDTQD